MLLANIHSPTLIQILPTPVVNLEKFLLERVMPYFVLLTWRNKVKNMMWWVELQRKIHFDVIEGDV
jgi:hypothetical protein